MRVSLSSRIGALAAIAGATCLVLAGSVSAAHVGWNEAAKSGGDKVMTYTVDSLTFDSKGWRAHVSFKNVSHLPIGLATQREFGAALFADNKTETLSQAIGFATATNFSTKLPTKLEPGDSWSGTISGTGNRTMTRRIYARVVFGPFSGLPGTTTAVVWITDHALALGKAPVEVVPKGPVI
jgi:hypothetical protein